MLICGACRKFQSYAFISLDFIFVAVELCEKEGEKMEFGNRQIWKKGENNFQFDPRKIR